MGWDDRRTPAARFMMDAAVSMRDALVPVWDPHPPHDDGNDVEVAGNVRRAAGTIRRRTARNGMMRDLLWAWALTALAAESERAGATSAHIAERCAAVTGFLARHGIDHRAHRAAAAIIRGGDDRDKYDWRKDWA